MTTVILFVLTLFIAGLAGTYLKAWLLFGIIVGFVIIWCIKALPEEYHPYTFEDSAKRDRALKLLMVFIFISLFQLYMSTSQTFVQDFANAYIWR